MDLPCQCEGHTLWCSRAPNFLCHRETLRWPFTSGVNRGERSCNHSGGNTSMFMCRAALSLGLCCCTSAVCVLSLSFSSIGGPLAVLASHTLVYWLSNSETKWNVDLRSLDTFQCKPFTCFAVIGRKSNKVCARKKHVEAATKYISRLVSLQQAILKVLRSEEIQDKLHTNKLGMHAFHFRCHNHNTMYVIGQ